MNPGGATSASAIGAGRVRRAGRERLDERRGDGQRWAAERPGELHREVRREVAVLRLGGPLDLDRRAWHVARMGRQRPGCLGGQPMPGRGQGGRGIGRSPGSSWAANPTRRSLVGRARHAAIRPAADSPGVNLGDFGPVGSGNQRSDQDTLRAYRATELSPVPERQQTASGRSVTACRSASACRDAAKSITASG